MPLIAPFRNGRENYPEEGVKVTAWVTPWLDDSRLPRIVTEEKDVVRIGGCTYVSGRPYRGDIVMWWMEDGECRG